MATEAQLLAQLRNLGGKLSDRAFLERVLDRYYEGRSPLPDVIVRAKVTRAYMLLMGQATAPWGSVVVDSVTDRLEVTGINSSDDDQAAQDVWDIWQDQNLDAESKLVHESALISGRAFGMVWPDDDGDPEITFDNSSQMCIKYAEGSRTKKQSAMRYWWDEDDRRGYANLYLPDGIYKFVGPKDVAGPMSDAWQRNEVPGEDWPVANPFGVIPIVEFPVNRRLVPGAWGHARGEYEHVCPVIDKINLLTFLGLVVAFWQGFPIRAVIGERILHDDNNDPIAPFTIGADQVVQFENPDVKLDTFAPADRSNLSIYEELTHLATLTKTPITYFPSSGSISNLSADAIRGLESGLCAKIPRHKATLGSGWVELLQLAGLMSDQPIILPSDAKMAWTDHENRSLAERADAASKLVNILPQSALIEYVLNATSEEQDRWKAEEASSTIGQLLTAAAQPQPQSPIAPAATTGTPTATLAPAHMQPPAAAPAGPEG